MKKLLFMINCLQLGGQEKAIINLLKAFADRSWEITLLMIREEGEFLPEVPEYVIVKEAQMPEDIREEVSFATPVIIRNHLRSGRILKAGKAALKYLRRRNKGLNEIMRDYFEEYDRRLPALKESYEVAIDYQGQGSFPTYYIANKVRADRKISWIHNDYTVEERPTEWICPLYEKYDRIVSVSQKAEEAFIKRFPAYAGKAGVCYNVLPAAEIREKADAFFVAGGEGVNIVTVGRLAYQKGYDVALRALAKWKDRGSLFDYYIVGAGEQRKALEDLSERLGLQENVHFEGFQSNPYPYMKMCDIYLQPSRFEGFCITLGEAKALGRPIVTTDFAGADEQIINDEQGLIVPCDAVALYQALLRMTEEPCLMDKLKKNLENASVEDKGMQDFCSLLKA